MKSDLLQIINDNINPNNIKEILDKKIPKQEILFTNQYPN